MEPLVTAAEMRAIDRETIDGIGLPADVLGKVYGGNAARLLGITPGSRSRAP